MVLVVGAPVEDNFEVNPFSTGEKIYVRNSTTDLCRTWLFLLIFLMGLQVKMQDERRCGSSRSHRVASPLAGRLVDGKLANHVL